MNSHTNVKDKLNKEQVSEILNCYRKCEFPNIAAECFNTKKRMCVLAENTWVTEELLRAYLDGTEELTMEEILRLMGALQPYSVSTSEYHNFTYDYALRSKLSYYNLKKKSHYNKVKRLYIKYETALKLSGKPAEHVLDTVPYTFDEIVKRGVVTRAYINNLIDSTHYIHSKLAVKRYMQRPIRGICKASS